MVKQTKVQAIVEPIVEPIVEEAPSQGAVASAKLKQQPVVLKQQVVGINASASLREVINPKKQEPEGKEKVIQRRIDELEKAITNKKIKRTEKANDALQEKLNALEKQLAELETSSEEEEPIKQRIIKTKPIKIPTIPSNKPTYLTRADVIKSFGF
jgi:polyhydroxyalkanoate synthesis regulator phasin